MEKEKDKVKAKADDPVKMPVGLTTNDPTPTPLAGISGTTDGPNPLKFAIQPGTDLGVEPSVEEIAEEDVEVPEATQSKSEEGFEDL